jgi:hypothetical protein
MSGFLNKLVRGALGDILNKPKTDVGNLPKKEGVSRRGFLAGGGALGAGVLSDIPYKKVIDDLFPRVIPKILPKDFMANIARNRAKKALTRQLGFDFKNEMKNLDVVADQNRIAKAERLEEFLKGNFEPKNIRKDLGFPENWKPVPYEDLKHLFKNKSDLNKYLELHKLRSESRSQAFWMADAKYSSSIDPKSEWYTGTYEDNINSINRNRKSGFSGRSRVDNSGDYPTEWDPNLQKNLEKVAEQADVDMLKLLRDANNNNALNEDFYKQSRRSMDRHLDYEVDPIKRASGHYKSLLEIKKRFGDKFDEITFDEIDEMFQKNKDKKNEIIDYLRQLDPSIPTPKHLDDGMISLHAEYSLLNSLQRVKLRKSNPEHMQEFFEYQQKNNFTDEEMSGILDETIEEAEKILDALEDAGVDYGDLIDQQPSSLLSGGDKILIDETKLE